MKCFVLLSLLCYMLQLSACSNVGYFKGSSLLDFCNGYIFFSHSNIFGDNEKIGVMNTRGDLLVTKDEELDNLRCSPDGSYVYTFNEYYRRIERRSRSTLEMDRYIKLDYDTLFLGMAVSADGNIWLAYSDTSEFFVAQYDASLEAAPPDYNDASSITHFALDFVYPDYQVATVESFQIDAGGVLYFAYTLYEDHDPIIERFDSSGTRLADIGVQFTGKHIAVQDGYLFVAVQHTALFAYDIGTAEVQWLDNSYTEGTPLAADGGYVLVIANDDDRIDVLQQSTGKVKHRVGRTGDRSIDPAGLGVRPDGKLTVAARHKGVLLLTPSGKIKKTYKFKKAIDFFALSPVRDEMYLNFDNEEKVKRYSKKKDLKRKIAAALDHIEGVTTNSLGDVLVHDRYTDEGPTLLRYARSGDRLGKKKMNNIVGAACDSGNNVHVLQDGSSKVKVLNPKLKRVKRTWGNAFPLIQPEHIHIDSSDRVYVTDETNVGVHVYTKKGKFLFSIGQDVVSQPSYVAATPNVKSGVKRFIYVIDGDQVVKLKYKNGAYVTRWFC